MNPHTLTIVNLALVVLGITGLGYAFAASAYRIGRSIGRKEVNDAVVAKVAEGAWWSPKEPVHVTAPDEVHAILRAAVHDLNTATGELEASLNTKRAALNNTPVR